MTISDTGIELEELYIDPIEIDAIADIEVPVTPEEEEAFKEMEKVYDAL